MRQKNELEKIVSHEKNIKEASTEKILKEIEDDRIF